eukprot:CAMPEP_0113501812 /NCGR_PEP_ID=MMETSP0014_2-20120614/33174_1 /TAXON_ID=2857 /ORGANISM="Nitzschia sp." /LENGTH=281 /DNA_ID=CAMNT_0000396465 /DNA_START=12 /DNA_END=854 /DNA_ORIENTATION=- /assembly_acc=CAM_ASM_000159
MTNATANDPSTIIMNNPSSSRGGLLAEEYLMMNHHGRPSSPPSKNNNVLPSFLERMMIEEARRSMYVTFKFVVDDVLIPKLINNYREVEDDEEEEVNEQNESENSSVPSARRDDKRLSPWSWRMGLSSLYYVHSHPSSTTTMLKRRIRRLRRLYKQFLYVFATKLLRPYSSELRLLVTYWLERRSLLLPVSSSSGGGGGIGSGALIAELMYGCKRVKLGGVTTTSTTTAGATNADASEQQQQQQQQQRSLLPMSKRDAIRLAFFTAFVPYMEERSELFYQT